MSEETKAKPKHGLRQLLAIAFALSGMTALIYQIIWVRELKLIFGSTAFSVSLMLISILSGFALGSYLLRKKADEHQKPFILLFLLELAIGIYGILLILSFSAISYSIASLPVFLRYAAMFLLLLVPSLFFGAIWPVLNKIYAGSNEEIGKASGKLYFSNSMGSAFGAFSSGFILIPIFGLMFASLFASSVNIILALIFLKFRKRSEI